VHLNAIDQVREDELLRRRDELLKTRLRPRQQATEVPERARQLFNSAMSHYRARRYARAIILWERVRHLPGVPPNLKAACLYNVGQANMRLRRFATAMIYFETYIADTGISEKDRADAQARLDAAKRRLGITVQ
jgi:outer membrane protein assembly factor BamD (BamD/ComL family)